MMHSAPSVAMQQSWLSITCLIAVLAILAISFWFRRLPRFAPRPPSVLDLLLGHHIPTIEHIAFGSHSSMQSQFPAGRSFSIVSEPDHHPFTSMLASCLGGINLSTLRPSPDLLGSLAAASRTADPSIRHLSEGEANVASYMMQALLDPVQQCLKLSTDGDLSTRNLAINGRGLRFSPDFRLITRTLDNGFLIEIKTPSSLSTGIFAQIINLTRDGLVLTNDTPGKLGQVLRQVVNEVVSCDCHWAVLSNYNLYLPLVRSSPSTFVLLPLVYRETSPALPSVVHESPEIRRLLSKPIGLLLALCYLPEQLLQAGPAASLQGVADQDDHDRQSHGSDDSRQEFEDDARERRESPAQTGPSRRRRSDRLRSRPRPAHQQALHSLAGDIKAAMLYFSSHVNDNLQLTEEGDSMESMQFSTALVTLPLERLGSQFLRIQADRLTVDKSYGSLHEFDRSHLVDFRGPFVASTVDLLPHISEPSQRPLSRRSTSPTPNLVLEVCEGAGNGHIWSVVRGRIRSDSANPCPVVAKFYVPAHAEETETKVSPMDRENIVNEAQMYMGPLRKLAGEVVPVYHGLWGSLQPRFPSDSKCRTMEVWTMVLEDVGLAVGPTLSQKEKDQICSLYARLHSAGVIHGDVDYKHWRRGTDGRIRLIDFDQSFSVLDEGPTNHRALEMDEVNRLLYPEPRHSDSTS